MGLKRQNRLQPSRRTVLICIGAFVASVCGVRLGTPPAASGDLPRAVLFEEDTADPTGKRFSGVVQWTNDISANTGASGSMVRASVAIPERQMILRWTLQRNADRSLPASHTIDLVFSLPPDFPHGGIQNVPGMLMKAGETAHGTPFRATVVKVSAASFLVGLSNVEAERSANLRLLKERGWFDVPIVYDDGRRAILAFEKGEAGKRVLDQALAAWEKTSDGK